METMPHPVTSNPVPDRIAVTPDEAAWLLGVSRSRIYELLNAGDLPSVKIGRSRRIPRQALVDFVAELECRAA